MRTATVTDIGGYARDARGEFTRPCWSEDPEKMFPEERGENSNDSPEVREAKAVCAGCFFKDECLRGALERGEMFGVWGALSTKDRLALKRRSYRRREATAADVPFEVAL